MEVSLNGVGKRFRHEWIFRKLDYTLNEGGKYAIQGPNGSGKSTLLKVLCGHLTPTKGQVVFFKNGQPVGADQAFQNISFAAPYIELIEEFSLQEMIDFHFSFKSILPVLRGKEIFNQLDLPKSARKKDLKFFSSGMKQRVKIGLSILSDTSLVLLDEPGTNLDEKGVAWYLDLVSRYSDNRTFVVASNVEADFSFCSEQLDIKTYKSSKK